MLAFVVLSWLFARQIARLIARIPQGASQCSCMDTSTTCTSGLESSDSETVKEICDEDNNESIAVPKSWESEDGESESDWKEAPVCTFNNEDDDGWLGDSNDKIEDEDKHCSNSSFTSTYILTPDYYEGNLITNLKERWLENREVTDDQRDDICTSIQTSSDPYDFLLILVKRTHKMSQGVKSLSRIALQEMQKWTEILTPEQLPKLTIGHKETAVLIGLDCSLTIFELLCSVFNLCSEDPSLYEPHVRHAIDSGQYKEVSMGTSFLFYSVCMCVSVSM